MTRVLAASRIATLLGEFDRSPAYKGLAEGLRVLVTDGRVPVGPGCPASASSPRPSRSAAPPSPGRTPSCATTASWSRARAPGSVASLPATRGHRGDHLLPPGDLPQDKIDLTCAAPVPGPGVLAAYEKATAELPAYLGGTGYYPSGCRCCARPSPRRTTPAACPPAPARS